MSRQFWSVFVLLALLCFAVKVRTEEEEAEGDEAEEMDAEAEGDEAEAGETTQAPAEETTTSVGDTSETTEAADEATTESGVVESTTAGEDGTTVVPDEEGKGDFTDSPLKPLVATASEDTPKVGETEKESAKAAEVKEEIITKEDVEKVDAKVTDVENVASMIKGAEDVTLKNCQVSQVLVSMKELLIVLSSEIGQLKKQVKVSCFAGNETEEEDVKDSEVDRSSVVDEIADALGFGNDTMASMNETDDGFNVTEEATAIESDNATSTLPPPPTHCKHPFRMEADGCFLVIHDHLHWRTWGDANAVCQSYGGMLAAPWRFDQFREYLSKAHSFVFWVGARYNTETKEWGWINGRPVDAKEWKTGFPKHHSRFCVYVDAWSQYKASNHFCGDKNPFVCEYQEPKEKS